MYADSCACKLRLTENELFCYQIIELGEQFIYLHIPQYLIVLKYLIHNIKRVIIPWRWLEH